MDADIRLWNEKTWIGSSVQQIDGIQELIGRTGVVIETFWDENDHLHCKMDPEGWWCPANLLKIVGDAG